MRDPIINITFPVRSAVLMMELAGMDVCPNCGGPLDTGKVCTRDSSSWHLMVPARLKWAPPSPEEPA